MDTGILIVDDDTVQQEILRLFVETDLGYKAYRACDGRGALLVLQRQADIRLVILDLGLPDIDGLDLLEMIGQRHPGLPVIILTGKNDLDVAVRAIKAGACDFLTKPPEKERLQVAVKNALRVSVLEKEVLRLKRRDEGAFTFEQLVGHDGGLQDVIRTGRKAASSDIPVLLTGETGAGKEVFARAVHGESRRVGEPFVAVNCGAIPAQLVESTLFGHEKGAFTGAIARASGRFRDANGGTIFLDEIGDLPLDAQVKLLRVLQQKEVVPVGASSPIPVNVRVISATNRDLAAAVKEGRFREDLYFRLNVLPIHLPALRDRRDDIPSLVHHFIERISVSERRALCRVESEAMTMLKRHAWPGNVRELENVLHRVMVMADSDILSIADFSALSSRASVNTACAETSSLMPRPLADVEADAIQGAILYYNGNMTQAAESLGIAKSTLYRKMERVEK